MKEGRKSGMAGSKPAESLFFEVLCAERNKLLDDVNCPV
jgi:hypothetical protein